MKYPVGIETFSSIIEEGYAYVDKTQAIYQLIETGQYFFLSRPRRFGKSLMLSTMEAYFEGRKELFKGLWLGQAEGVDWTPRPVFRLNFVTANSRSSESLKSLIASHLSMWERKYSVTTQEDTLEQRFSSIIRQVYEKTNTKVAILIDEYDKALVNTMHDPDLHEEMKDILKPLFAVLKEADRYIRFAILTGVSRFSKLSIFSDLNNLEDISLLPSYSTLCGITEDEVRRYFAPGVEEFAKEMDTDFEGMMEILKNNYDGYHFSKNSPDIYNPFSLISALKNKEILHRWFESGTPTFLMKRISQTDEDLKSLLEPVVSISLLTNTSIADSNLTNILYQTGYLTIKSYDAEEDEYTLGIPNKEVAMGMYRNLLPFYNGREIEANDNMLRKLRRAANKGEATGFVDTLRSYFAGIPYHLSEGKHEIYYENNLFIVLSLIGFDIRTEEPTSYGRIDAVLKTAKYIYILELKLNGTAEEAMQQIKNRQYALPFTADNRQIIRIAMNFSSETRNIDDCIID